MFSCILQEKRRAKVILETSRLDQTYDDQDNAGFFSVNAIETNININISSFNRKFESLVLRNIEV